MLFCMDIGNTNTVMGVINGDKILHHWRIRTEPEITSDELAILVSNLFGIAGVERDHITDMIISCVVPPLLNSAESFAGSFFSLKPLVISEGPDAGMPVLVDNPREVGADRVVNAVAAYEKYRTGLIVVDFGTATTFDYVSPEGAYMGGAIAPGVVISCEALFQKASKLPRVEIFKRPSSVIGKDTISSMNVGIIHGYAGLVDGIVKRMRAETGQDLKVIATGGLAAIICEASETIEHVEPFLTLEGLIIIHRRIG